MSTGTSIEQRLKSQMDGVQVRLRPGLAREAYRAHRRHLLRSWSATAVAAAIVIAAGATVAASGRVPFGAAPQVLRPTSLAGQSGAFLPPARMLPPPPGDDLTAQQAARDIFWLHMTLEAVPATDTWVTNQFNYGGTARLITYSADGSPGADTVNTPTSSTSVSYHDRAWVRRQVSGGTSSVPGQARTAASARQLCLTVQQYGLGVVNFRVQPDAARLLVTCPGLLVTRGQRIEGLDAITLGDAKQGETLWVNAVTYLPVQLTFSHPPGARSIRTPGPGYYPYIPEMIQYGFLPPTSANLPYLSAPLPPGFKGTIVKPTSHSQDSGTVPVPLAP